MNNELKKDLELAMNNCKINLADMEELEEMVVPGGSGFGCDCGSTKASN